VGGNFQAQTSEKVPGWGDLALAFHRQSLKNPLQGLPLEPLVGRPDFGLKLSVGELHPGLGEHSLQVLDGFLELLHSGQIREGILSKKHRLLSELQNPEELLLFFLGFDEAGQDKG